MDRKLIGGKLLLLLVLITSIITLPSCGDSTDDVADSSLTGTWYGTRSYYNPVSGTKYQTLSVTFNTDGTGSLEYESPASYSVAYFTYSQRGSNVSCSGAWASSSSDAVETDFRMNFERRGDRLIPLDKYPYFILTKDGSVETDGDGNEVINDSNLLRQVWVQNDGSTVVVFSTDTYTEYVLAKPFGSVYTKKYSDSYIYDYRRSIINIGGTQFEVLVLSKSALQLRSASGKIFNYSAGVTADIPSDGGSSSESSYAELLQSPDFGWKDSSGKRIITFSGSAVSYMEQSTRKLGSYGYPTLDARGTYTIAGKNIRCSFDDIFWESGTSTAKGWFPGWTCGGSASKTYTIQAISTQSLTLVLDDGKSYVFTPF
ncbi:MAG: hypothetical protein NC418_11525 [Muribaculaceae bacterium]|nr:hypothetical protein [Muribaculaceae bacterium]